VVCGGNPGYICIDNIYNLSSKEKLKKKSYADFKIQLNAKSCVRGSYNDV